MEIFSIINNRSVLEIHCTIIQQESTMLFDNGKQIMLNQNWIYCYGKSWKVVVNQMFEEWGF